MLETIVVLSEGNPDNVKQRKTKQRKKMNLLLSAATHTEHKGAACHPFMTLILVAQTTFRFLGLNNTAGKNIFEEVKWGENI